jgi:hypothetical protein
VEALVQRLYGLHHFGRSLKDVKNGIVEAHQATYRERPYRVHGGPKIRGNAPRSASSGSRSAGNGVGGGAWGPSYLRNSGSSHLGGGTGDRSDRHRTSYSSPGGGMFSNVQGFFTRYSKPY